MRSAFLAAVAVLGFCLASLSPSASFAAQEGASIQLNKVAAVVNGEIITLHELRRYVGPELVRRGVTPGAPGSEQIINQLMDIGLNSMIDDILLRQEARRLSITVSDAEVDNELNMVIQRNQTTREAFEAGLAAQGQTMDMVRDRVRNSILSQRIISIMIARKVVVTKEDIERHYETHGHEFTADKSVDVSLIVFPPAANAESLAAKIQSGALSFENVAKEYSVGPQPAQGGRLGLVPWRDLIPPLQAAITNLEDGQVSQMFSLETYKAMAKLNASTAGRQMTLEEATPDIERVLREPLLQARFDEYTKLLRGKAVIDIRV